MKAIATLLVCLSTIGAAAPSELSTPFSVHDLDRMLTAQPHTRIEEILPLLPEDLLSNYTLMYQSESRQGADPLHPRAILYGQDASFLVAFGGSSSLQNNDILEMIQFEKSEAKFHFYTTYRDANKVLRIQEESEKCVACHHSDLRPNWEPYANWPGAYGSDDDMILAPTTPPGEYENLQTFLKTAESDPRYGFLKDLKVGYDPSIRSDPAARVNQLHNTQFIFRIAQLNYQRMARILRETPGYDRYKYAVLGSASCGAEFENFLPPGLLPKAAEWNPLAVLAPATGTPAFPALMRAWGVDWSEFSTSSGLVKSNAFSGDVFNSSSASPKEFAGALVDGDPDLQKFAATLSYQNTGAIARWALVGNCEALKQQSLKAYGLPSAHSDSHKWIRR